MKSIGAEVVLPYVRILLQFRDPLIEETLVTRGLTGCLIQFTSRKY